MIDIRTAPIDSLRIPSTPKPGDIVLFRPWGKSLDDVSYWRRYARTSRFFGLDPEPKRELVGRVKAIKRVGDEFYYRIESGMMGLDASPADTRKMPEGYWGS